MCMPIRVNVWIQGSGSIFNALPPRRVSASGRPLRLTRRVIVWEVTSHYVDVRRARSTAGLNDDDSASLKKDMLGRIGRGYVPVLTGRSIALERTAILTTPRLVTVWNEKMVGGKDVREG